MTDPTPSRQALQRFYEAEARYMPAEHPDFAPVAATLHPDCLICEPASLPYGGEWRGRDGVERWIRLFRLTWSSLDVRDSEIFGEGETLFSRSHVYAKARTTDKVADWYLLQLFTFKTGLVLELRPFHWDTAALLRSLS